MLVNREKTVLISGAGIGGPALASLLRRNGFRPTLVEVAPAPREGGYMIDFSGVGYDVAEKMGLIPSLRGVGYVMDELRLVDARGRRVGGFDARSFRAALRDRYFSIMRADLAREIYRTIEGEIEAIFDDSVRTLEQDRDEVHVTFRRSDPRSFDLVIGADGLHSAVRALAFGPEGKFEKYLGYYAASFAVADYPHRDEGVYVSYGTPGRQVARYALRDNRTAFLFVFAEPAKLALDHRDSAGHKETLRAAFANGGWEVPQILRLLDSTDELYFDTVSQIRLESWSRGRIALIGDAAYCPSLLAGQGAAFALAGAYVLGGELKTAGGDHAAAFAAYERRFQPFIAAKQRAAERFGGWFAPKTQLGLFVRNQVTRLMSIPVAGNWFFRRNFADDFHLPTYCDKAGADLQPPVS